jgi:tryptophan-rich sensory protein
MKFNPIAFVVNLAIPLAAGALGSILTLTSVKTWYPTLAKPSFNPPDWLFPPVWTSLFILMGFSAYLVWQKREQVAHFPRTIAVYFIQIVLNILWSFLFFYAHSIGAALFEIFALLIAIVINARVFYKIDKTAGLLFIPYFLWVCFATLLTYNIFSLNG